MKPGTGGLGKIRDQAYFPDFAFLKRLKYEPIPPILT